MIQGRVRTKTTKRASRVLIEKYYPRLTLDFHTNKRIIDEVVRMQFIRNPGMALMDRSLFDRSSFPPYRII